MPGSPATATPGPADARAQVIAAGTALAGQLARDAGPRRAAAWVHSAAVARYAADTGLVTLREGAAAPDAVRAALDDLAALHPALKAFADPGLNPLRQLPPPGPAADGLAGFWRDPRLTGPARRQDGYLLGDLYQALSEEARKNRALVQTPRFVTELLLELAWDPAYRERGPRIRMIDPACGTGHILVEALTRARSRQHLGFGRDHQPSLPRRTPPLERVTAALDTVHGVDLDPYAAACAALRLLGMARGILRAGHCDPSRADLADLPVHVAAADSLLGQDEPLLTRGAYHAVIANPPYVTCKDPAARQAIRARYRQVASGNYSLAVPFEPLMHELCMSGGWVARLTANSFMKREFGRKLIEDYFPTIDLRWVIDTSGAYIPGHGTPTVILVSRAQPPSPDRVHAVRGVRGEPSRPADPARGTVWLAITSAVREITALERLRAAVAANPAPAR